MREQFVEHHVLGVAAGIDVREADGVDARSRRSRAASTRRRRRPRGSITPGPTSTTSQQNSWPITRSPDGSNMFTVGSSGERASAFSSASLVGESTGFLAVLEQMEIAPTDAARQDLGEHLARLGGRHVDVVDAEFPVGHDGCAHPSRQYAAPPVPLQPWIGQWLDSARSRRRGGRTPRRRRRSVSTSQLGAAPRR